MISLKIKNNNGIKEYSFNTMFDLRAEMETTKETRPKMGDEVLEFQIGNFYTSGIKTGKDLYEWVCMNGSRCV